MKNTLQGLFFTSVLALSFSSCGTDAAAGSVFSANATDDKYTIMGDSSAQIFNVMNNDGGISIEYLSIADGLFGTVAINETDNTLEYTPRGPNDGIVYADWFEYVLLAGNNSFDVARVTVRFTDFTSDEYEPDDFQEFARPIQVNVGQPVFERHTSDIINNVGGGSYFGAGTSIGGDEDWFQLEILDDVTNPSYVRYLKIETTLPGGVPDADHNAVMVRVMDSYGFLANDISSLGAPVVNYANGPSGGDSQDSDHATTVDRPMAPGVYLVCINNASGGYHGEYSVKFSVYDAPNTIVAPSAIGQLTETEKE